MGNNQSGGGSRPIKTIQDDLEKEKEDHPNEETEEKIKFKDELVAAYERKAAIDEELENLQTDLESVGVVNEEENVKTSAKIASLKTELAALTEGIEEAASNGDGEISNNSSSVKVQPNTNEGGEGKEQDDLSPERCKKILKIPDESEDRRITGKDAPQKAEATKTASLFGSVYDFIFGLTKSSYWEETDEDRCRKILKDATLAEEEEPLPEEQDAATTAAEGTTAAAAAQGATKGGRRYTHKNREGRKKTRKQ